MSGEKTQALEAALKNVSPRGMTTNELASSTGISAREIPKLCRSTRKITSNIDLKTGFKSLPTTTWFYREDAEEFTKRVSRAREREKSR
ncbi:MAG: hypothetical protein DMG97_25600 [Acidobacteria bacterium]|nr:MAG: hypothetical protein DMG97_25600 [Acidobacteriota bacterium]PYV78797.1 MAG: hypothetical protein DMG96_06435 [Acidobacteriota bacterium]